MAYTNADRTGKINLEGKTADKEKVKQDMGDRLKNGDTFWDFEERVPYTWSSEDGDWI